MICVGYQPVHMGVIRMLTTDRKANADQRGKSSEEIVPVGKAIWHPPAVRRLETAPATHNNLGPGADGAETDGSNKG